MDPKAIEQAQKRTDSRVVEVERRVSALERPESVSVVKLNPMAMNLIGSYHSGATVVLALCDSTNAAFSVLLPSAKSSLNVTLHIKNSGTGSNKVTAVCQVGQKINTASSKDLNPGECIALISDGDNYHIV